MPKSNKASLMGTVVIVLRNTVVSKQNYYFREITRLSLASTTDNELFANITGGNRLIAMAVYPNSNLLALSK